VYTVGLGADLASPVPTGYGVTGVVLG
jgi:hypothetical protein